MNLLIDRSDRSWRSQILPLILGTGLIGSVWTDVAHSQPPSGGTAPATSQPAPPAASSADQLDERIKATIGVLERARRAMDQRNYVEALDLYRKARVNAQPLPQLQPQVATLRRALEAVGIDATLLDLPPSAPPEADQPGPANEPFLMPQNAQAVPGGDVTALKQEAARLISLGRTALDRGEVEQAIRLVRRAENLRVPESAFEVGEPRVWQLSLDVRSAARKAGIPFDITPPVGDSAVVQASGAMTVGDGPVRVGDGVVQSLFVDSDDSTRVQPAQATLGLSGGGQGEALYRRGLDSLAVGDTAKARELFVEAWKHEASMDLATRAQLKEKLTLLQPTRLPEPGRTADLTPIEREQTESEAETRRVYREVTAELAKAAEMRTTAPLEALDRLRKLSQRVDESKLDATASASLSVMVERAIKEQQQYVDANRAKIELDLANDAVRAQLSNDQARKQRIDDEIASLVETFNDLMEQRRYPEAEVVAKQVAELSPGSSIAKSMHHTSRMGTRLMINEEIAAMKEEGVAKGLLAVSAASIAMDPTRDIDFGDAQSWGELSRRRRTMSDAESRYSPIERQIQQQLSIPVEIKYSGTPLADVLQDLAAVANISIVLDARAMNDLQIASDSPVNLELTQSVSLRSALNLILSNFELTYLIENDVLKITSHDVKKTRVISKAYKVADLITPIPNFTSGYEDGLAGALRAAYQMTNQQADVQIMPMTMAGLAAGKSGATDPKTLAQFAASGSMAGGYGAGRGGRGGQDPSAMGGGFMPFELMNLIQTTISPDEWLDGTYSIAPYMQNLSLVISTTTEVHDQIAALLESLRKLQNIQVTIEVRFLTLSDSFFEQIGVDFDLSFDDNINRLPNDDTGPRVKIGWDGQGPTADFDIKLNNDFSVTPAFGAFDAGTGSRFGFAILSDIEAFFFLQAAQGNSRTSVLQAPKVTLFDGQMASINDTVNRPFVMSIQPVVGDFAVAQQPIVVVINEGTQLTVQAVVSDDKRFVRMTLMPYFSQIGEVNTFTYEGRRRRSSNNVQRDPVTGEPINNEEEDEFIEGTTVQQPTLAQTSVSTTVSVPDGGTILLGGIKRMREGRNERGVPILSKIPYISRLFRNVAIGSDAQSLMMMVTPRIIIQEEEELVQTGFDPTR